MNNFNEQGNGFLDMMPANMMTLPNNMFQNNTLNPNQMNSNMQTGIQGNTQLSTPQEGFMRGNLFGDLYQQYKNYRPAVLTPRNEKDRLFLNYAQLAFAAHELNLYLDNFPNDRSINRLFNDYRTMSNQALRAYEEKFGPITITSEQLNQFPWMWEQLNFPWDEGGM